MLTCCSPPLHAHPSPATPIACCSPLACFLPSPAPIAACPPLYLLPNVPALTDLLASWPLPLTASCHITFAPALLAPAPSTPTFLSCSLCRPVLASSSLPASTSNAIKGTASEAHSKRQAMHGAALMASTQSRKAQTAVNKVSLRKFWADGSRLCWVGQGFV